VYCHPELVEGCAAFVSRHASLNDYKKSGFRIKCGMTIPFIPFVRKDKKDSVQARRESGGQAGMTLNRI